MPRNPRKKHRPKPKPEANRPSDIANAPVILPDDIALSEKPVLIGKITNAHGMHGAVSVRSFCEIPESLTDYQPLFDVDGMVFDLRLLDTAPNGALRVRLNGINNRTAAEALRGKELYTLESVLPKPGEEEYRLSDLSGLDVQDVEGHSIGTIIAAHNFGAGDLLEIQFRQKNNTELFSFTKENFPTVALDQGYVTWVAPDILEAKP